MNQADTKIITLLATELGGPAAPSFAQCSAAATALLADAAGAGMRMTSLAIDVTAHALADQSIDVSVRVDKRAKSIVFASAEARAGGQLVFTAQGLFCRSA